MQKSGSFIEEFIERDEEVQALLKTKITEAVESLEFSEVLKTKIGEAITSALVAEVEMMTENEEYFDVMRDIAKPMIKELLEKKFVKV